MKTLCLAAFVSLNAFAQGIVNDPNVLLEWHQLHGSNTNKKLACKVTPFKPHLDFTFRFETGFSAEVPLKQYSGKGHWLAAVFRVTPEDPSGAAVLFGRTARLPDVPAGNKATGELFGGFALGEGKYRVEWILADDSGRVCQRDWKVEAKLDGKEKEVIPGMPSGVIDEISLRRWIRESKGPAGNGAQRATVLLNVASFNPRRVRLNGSDRLLLLSSLAALIERLPVASLQLIVFNLEQHREIYRKDDFQPRDFDAVSHAINGIELGTVDYKVLSETRGHVDMVTDLISKSVEESKPDVVIFVGPKPRYLDKVGKEDLPARSSDAPLFYNVQFRAFYGPNYPDTIMNAVKRMGGKTFEIFSPKQFAEAITGITKAFEGK